MSRHTQPKESIQIIIRLADGAVINPIVIPFSLIQVLPALIQAAIYQHKAPEFIAAEERDEPQV